MEKQDDGGSSGSSNSCPICIGPFHNESYLDKCFQKDGKRPTVASRKRIPLHQKTIPHTEEPSSKRQKVYSSTSSLVVSNLGSIAEPFIKDKDILAWQAQSSEEVRLAMVKASAELYYHTLTRQSEMADLRVRIKTLEFEKKQLSKEFLNMKKKRDQLKKDSKASISRLQSDKMRLEKALENKEEQLTELEEVADEQKEQINLLKVDKEKGLSDSIAKVKKDSHIAGFRDCLKGFFAVDPRYDWGKFGEDAVKYMAEFAVLEADAIKAKKALIEANRVKAA